MNLLFLSRWFPLPIDNGAKLRVFNLLRVLARNHTVTLLSFNDRPEQAPAIAAMQEICEKVIAIPWKTYQPTSAKAILGLLHPNPRAVLDTYSPAMAQAINRTLAASPYDAVIASQIETASYFGCFGALPAVFEEIEIGVPFERYTHAQHPRARLRAGLTWWKHRRYLKRILRRFAACTVASEKERQLLQTSGIRQHAITVIPNFVELSDYQPYHPTAKTCSLIFTGSFRYQPNHEAMCWFIEQVFPAITQRYPDLQLHITGDHLGLPLPSHPNVRLTGHIADEGQLRSLLAGALVSIAPLQTGGGTRLKIIEALAVKTCVVSTSKGAEGIAARHGEHLLIADEPQAFAQAVMTVIEDASLQQNLAANGYRLVQAMYSAEAIGQAYENLLHTL
jgi:glycosyltransferase involved in cell wall biosynthesis